jgi:cell division protein FtsX
MNYSLTQAGNLTALVGVVMFLLNHFGIAIPEDELLAVVTGIASVVGILISWIGRYRKGDLTIAGTRK